MEDREGQCARLERWRQGRSLLTISSLARLLTLAGESRES